MKRTLLPLVAAGVALSAATARADYLEIRRSAELKAAPESAASSHERLTEGTLVAMVKGAQQNGYYAVTRAGQPGFVYRTLVRRHRGALPGAGAEVADGVEEEPADAEGPLMRVHAIDVGQGAATLLEFSCGAVLVDTGGETNGEFDSERALRGYLDAFFDRRTDLNRTLAGLVITHPHLDHARNARMVAEQFTVQNVITDGLTTSSGGRQQEWLQNWATQHATFEAIPAEEIAAGGVTSGVIDPVACADGDPRLTVLWGALGDAPDGWSEEEFDNANNHSVVLRAELGRASVLISGDLELHGIEALMEKHEGTGALDVDLWHVGHHGSQNATTAELLDALTPKIALLSTGSPARQVKWSAWQYGHPRQNVIDLLLAELTRRRPAVSVPVATRAKEFQPVRLDEAIYATGWNGSIVVTARSDGTYSVATQR
jgi:competence protein ComEC